MSESWQSALDRWSSAGLVDSTTAARIREFEGSQEEPKHLRWPILIAIGFGALMLAAGVLLFVSAHWDDLSPSGRFSLVLILVAIFHAAGAIFSDVSQPSPQPCTEWARLLWELAYFSPRRFSICRNTGPEV